MVPSSIDKMVEPDIEMRDSAPLRRVNIKSMQGQVRTVELPCDSFIRDLKVKIAQVFSVQPERQRLIFQGKLLKDEMRLSEYIKEDGLTVHMMAKAEEIPRSPSAQPAGPQPAPQTDPFASLLGAMGANIPGMPQPPFPEGMQAFQMQFGPGVQFIQGVQPGVPVQIRFQPGPVPPGAPLFQPPQGPVPQGAQVPVSNTGVAPAAPPPGSREERKVREIVLPFAHVHNLGQIVNSMMGPNAAFPHPPMPQLPVSRNTLVLLGGFLYNYQFQLMRLIPFLSRLADLLQRESLMTEPTQRAELQRFSRAMGAALNEIQHATQPVVDLFQLVEIGPAPGQYHIRVHDASIVSQSEAAAVPRPSQANAPPANSPQSVLESLLNPANLPADSPLARMVPTLQQAMSGGMGNMSLRDLMMAANVHENEEDLPLTEFMYNLTMPELTALMSGDVAPLDRIRPTVVQSLRQVMGGMDTPEGRERILEVYQQYLQTHLIFPESYRSRQRPGFDYIQSTLQIVRKAVSRLVSLVLEDSSNEFGARFKREFQQRVGEWVEAVISGMEGGAQTMEQLLRTQMEASMAEMGGGENVAPLLAMSNAIVQQLLVSCLQARRLEREAMDPTAGLIETWSATVEADLKVQAQQRPQGPFSRAYRSLDALRPPSEPSEHIQPKKLLRTLLAQSLQDSNLSLQGAEMSADLTDAFITSLACDIRVRASQNPDFDPDKSRHIQELLRR